MLPATLLVPDLFLLILKNVLPLSICMKILRYCYYDYISLFLKCVEITKTWLMLFCPYNKRKNESINKKDMDPTVLPWQQKSYIINSVSGSVHTIHFFGFNCFSGIVFLHREMSICVINFFEFE